MKKGGRYKKSAKQLCDTLITLFSQQKEVSRISLFGRLVEETYDEYSDVDIRIISADPLLTQKNYLKLIEKKISPVRSSFFLTSDKNIFGGMLMLEAYPPYQKIDFDIEREGFGIDFKPCKNVFVNQKATGANKDLEIFEITKNVSYNLQNVLFGIPRMTKCFFRKDFDMYRRWKNLTNLLLVLLHEKYFGYQEICDKKELGANEAKNLFQKLTKNDQWNLNKIFPTNGHLKIAESYLRALQMFNNESRVKAAFFNLPINDDFVKYMVVFAESELRKSKRSILFDQK